MKKVLVIVLLIFAFLGCQRYPSEPGETLLYGEWKSELITLELEDGSQVNTYLIIDFEYNGFFTISDDIQNKNIYYEYGSYELVNDIMIIENYNCLDIEGLYRIKFKNSHLEIELIEDHCEKNHLLSGIFFKNN